MRENIVERAKQGKDATDRQNRLREELHHLILQEADRKEAFRHLCFVGGTALRILYGMERYSEDLDFSLSTGALPSFDLTKLTQAVQKSLVGFGLECALEKPKTVGAAHSVFFTFTGLLWQIDRRFRTQQKLAIKFDVDTRPPAGGKETISPVTGQRVYKLRHYNLPSLFAGKLHALLYRTYTKGRDLFDFLWYVGRGVEVNGRLLKNAITQSTGNAPVVTTTSLQEQLTDRFKKLDFAAARKDVAPFLPDPATLGLFEPEVFLSAVSRVTVVK